MISKAGSTLFQCPQKNTEIDGCQCWHPAEDGFEGFCGMRSQSPDYIIIERSNRVLRAAQWKAITEDAIATTNLKKISATYPSVDDLKVAVQLEVSKQATDILSTTAKTAVDAVIGTVIHDAVTDAVSRVSSKE
jgi:hypothetical protein